jgi:hypothetical protein
MYKTYIKLIKNGLLNSNGISEPPQNEEPSLVEFTSSYIVPHTRNNT